MPKDLQALFDALVRGDPAPPRPPARPPLFQPRGPVMSQGLIDAGNVNLYGQPSVANPAGGRSTVQSIGVNFDGREYVLPTVTPDGRLLTEEEAIAEFQRTGRHLGVFDTPAHATTYAGQLHDEYAAGKYARDPGFARWAQQHGINTPDAPEQFYDYRAAYRAGATPDASGHWPSAHKRPGHPNEIVGGFNTRTGERVPGTPRASVAELVRLGWDPATARQLAATPEPAADGRANTESPGNRYHPATRPR